VTRGWWATVRARLTLAYVAAMLLVLAIYAGGVFLFVSRSVSRTLDSRIRADFMWAAEMWQASDDGQLRWFDADDVQSDEDNPWLQVWAADGRLVFQTAVARRNPLPGSAGLARAASGDLTRVDGDGLTFRVLSRAVVVGDQAVVIQVARSEAPMRRELYELVLILALGLPFGVGAAALGGYLLARGALAPIGRMAERARTITAQRLSSRLPVDNPDDELGRLAGTFNCTLERLQQSFLQMHRFTEDVSHELRTPLMAMRTVGEVALREQRPPEGYRTTIGSMLEEADRLKSLVDRLLMLARAGAADEVRLEALDLGAVADDVVQQLSVLAEEKQQTMDVVHHMATPCRADRMMLRQALTNLIDNAIKYSPERTTIVIETRVDGDGVVVSVADSGPGVDHWLRPRLFERFARGTMRGDAHGFGLGLAIARAAADVHRGTLTWDARPSGGSVFRLSLPYDAALTLPGDAVVLDRAVADDGAPTGGTEPAVQAWMTASPAAPLSRPRR